MLLQCPFAVAGISCINPRAPAWDTASTEKALSWRISASTQALSRLFFSGSRLYVTFVFQRESQLQIVPIPGSGQGEYRLGVPVPTLSQFRSCL